MMSNYYYEPTFQYKNAIDKVKRVPLSSSKATPLRAEDFADIVPDGKIKFIVIDDVPNKEFPSNIKGEMHPEFFITKDGKTIDSKSPYESMIDGWVIIPDKIFERIKTTEGYENSTSRMKPVVYARVNGQVFAIKGGLHPSSPEYFKNIGGDNIGIVMKLSLIHI